MIELMAAMVVLSIALLALLAGYGSAVVSLRSSAEKTTASALADAQMERYRALPYTSIGLDETTTDAVGNSSNGAYDSLYVTNPILAGDIVIDPVTGNQSQLPSGTVNDVTISGCGSSANCLPIQTVTGNDNNSYRIETFIRDQSNDTTSSIRWTERIVTVVVRDARTSGTPVIVELTSGFDRGPSA